MKPTALVLAGLAGLAIAGTITGRQATPEKDMELFIEYLETRPSGFGNTDLEIFSKYLEGRSSATADKDIDLFCKYLEGRPSGSANSEMKLFCEYLKSRPPGIVNTAMGYFSEYLKSRTVGAPTQGPAPATSTTTSNGQAQAPFKPDIRADTNRDGVVDLTGSSDTKGKNEWTDALGAIFLANIGDSGDRCKQLGLSKDPKTPIETLAKCHDAEGDQQRAPQFLAPLRTVPIQGLSKSAIGSVTVSDAKVRLLVRIFRARDNGWEIVSNDFVFSADEVGRGLTLGIDARDTRRAGWDGRVTVDFTVKDGEASSKDTVMLRVAPVLIHHHNQPVQKVFASGFPGMPRSMMDYIFGLMKGIEGSKQKAQVAGPITFLPTLDPWAQDYFEPGYTSMPGPNGSTISLRVMIEGRRNSRDSVRLLYTQLRGDGVGALEAVPPLTNPRPQDDTFQAGGNMEAIPPYELKGKKFPAGRVVVGGDDANFPRARDFFRAQEVQDPIVLDSTWLFVKHFDEMIQFVPSKTQRGWSIMAIDPQLGLTMLRDAQKRGFGGQPIISSNKIKSGPTIDQFLATESNIQAAETSGKRMTANIDRMKQETGITDAEIFRVPSLIGVAEEVHKLLRSEPGTSKRRRSVYARIVETHDEATDVAEFLSLIDIHGPGGDSANTTAGVQRRQSQSQPAQPISLESYLPALVNGLPLSNSVYLAPKPFGPVIHGRDIFETAATDAYQKAGFATVDFLDEWKFHSVSGDLHCMTNTFRDASKPWWQL